MSEQLIPTPGVFGDNDNFLLERELGSGGMGGVYMGRDKMLDRPVAVKVMLKEYGEDPEFVDKFKKEAQAAARLIHPNIVQIYSYGICKGMPYMAMELATGGSLYTIMQNSANRPEIQRVVKICQQTAQALQCANDLGFVHGDVKPENILLDANGNAKLVDFGLAAMQKDTDEIWGTPYYISPEKVRKEQIDFRADMYSLGCTMYHALTGTAPFEAPDMIEVIKKRFTEVPKKPSELRKEISPALDELVMKMIALNREDRYPSFEALLEAFRTVLTSGLVTTSISTAAINSATTAAGGKSTGARRMTVRGRRSAMMKRPGTSIKKKLEGEEGDEGALDETEKPESDDKDDDEEEGGGNLAVKVVMFVILGIVAILAVVGGLIWFKISSDRAEEEAVRQQIESGYQKGSSAIADTVKKAAEFADEFDVFAQKAIDAVEKPTKELMGMLPKEEGDQLKPAPTKELLDAIASTNPAPAVVDAPAPAAASNQTAAVSNAAPAQAAAPAKPADPKAAPAAKPAPAPAAPAKAPADAKAAEAAKPAEKSQIVITMNELWERAYGCQASAIRIRKMSNDIIEKAKAADECKEVNRQNMDKLATISRELVELVDQMKTSKDVENVRKGITFIKSKGEKAVEQTVKRLRKEKLEAERKAKQEAAEAAEKARKEAAEKAHKEKVEEEEGVMQQKFDAIVAQGCIRQLDWKTALRLLETAKDELTTSEGQLAADLQIRKINNMKKVQDIFLKKAKNHVFKTGKKFKGSKIAEISEKEIVIVSKDGKGKMKTDWQKFYNKNPGLLNELFNVYIINGRKNAGLNLKDWADTMTGAALTMQLVCSEVNGATEKAEQLAKKAYEEFPEYQKTCKAIFPEIAFDGEEEGKEGEESKDDESKDDAKAETKK